jgi:hypothetical protein
MRLLLLALAAALIVVAIRWLVSDGSAVVRSAPAPSEQARDRTSAPTLARSEALEEVGPPEDGRQPVADARSPSVKLAAELELRHKGDGPVKLFRLLTSLRQKRSLGIHEAGLKRFRAGEGVVHLGKWTEPNEELAGYWINEHKQLVRVVIPEEGNGPLYRVHREKEWFESQIDSFRWSAAEMQELAKTVFTPSGEGAEVRGEYLDALRDVKRQPSQLVGAVLIAETEPEPAGTRADPQAEDRVIRARQAYLAARDRVTQSQRTPASKE